MILDVRYIINIRNDALYDFTLIKMAVPPFVVTGNFLIRYSNGHTKLTFRRIKVLDYKSDVWLTVHRNSVWIRKTN
jgi:hypothetical protein